MKDTMVLKTETYKKNYTYDHGYWRITNVNNEGCSTYCLGLQIRLHEKTNLNIEDNKEMGLYFMLENFHPSDIKEGFYTKVGSQFKGEIVILNNRFIPKKIQVELISFKDDMARFFIKGSAIQKEEETTEVVFKFDVYLNYALFNNEKAGIKMLTRVLPEKLNTYVETMSYHYYAMRPDMFCKMYQSYYFFKDSQDYYDSYYHATFIARVIIGVLIEAKFIKEYLSGEGIDPTKLLNYFSDQKVKLISFQIHNDNQYLACIPAKYSLKELEDIYKWLHIVITDCEIRNIPS